ncbi:hypothetical protein ADK38_31180 [Streptomyces varsoviensis]|uniref:Uncharacterized protein n=1 Tax=Streptomyces varsoviensis TaxID=67373 RepID=A0ABR5IZ36_9ACTN|nr:hypothetical protein ADK38_31180 [Streptomyces varsoviensis]
MRVSPCARCGRPALRDREHDLALDAPLGGALVCCSAAASASVLSMATRIVPASLRSPDSAS